MLANTNRPIWYWARLVFLVLVAAVVVSAGTDSWQVVLPGALLIVGGALMVIFGGLQWALLAMLKRFLPGHQRSIPYSLKVNPVSGECFFITGFFPFVMLAIAAGLTITVMVNGFWQGFWHVAVLVSIGLFWMRWNGLLARRYCQWNEVGSRK